MQASQAPKAAEENEHVPKANTVPESAKRSPKKSYTRAEGSEGRRKAGKAALGKKTVKRSKQPQVKQMEVPPNEVAQTTKLRAPQNAEQASKNVKASGRNSQGTTRAEGNVSEGNVAGGQTATAQKLDDIMKILESPKNQGTPEHQVHMGQKAKPSSTATKRKAEVVATLKKLQSSGKRPALKSHKAAAIIAYHSNQLLAYLKKNHEETPESLHRLSVMSPTLVDSVED